MKTIIYNIFLLSILLLTPGLLNCQNATLIGRAIIALDGYNNQHGDLVRKSNVTIARYFEDDFGTWREESYKVTTDENGYYIINDIPIKGFYRVANINVGGKDGDNVKSIIPSPMNRKGPALMLAIFFSSRKTDAETKVIDNGSTTLIIDEEGSLSIKLIKGINELSYSKDGFKKNDINYYLDVAKYFSNNQAIMSYYNNRQSYLSALPHFENAKELITSDLSSAKKELEKAINIYPAYQEATLKLVNILIQESDYSEATNYIKRARVLEPENLTLLRKECLIYDKRKDHTNVITSIKQFLADNEDNPDAFTLLAYYTNKYDGINAVDKVWDQYILESQNIKKYMHAGSFYYSERMYDKAIEYFTNYYNENSDNDWSMIYLASAYVANGQDDKAREMMKALPVANVYFKVSIEAERIKNYDLAIEFMEKAIEFMNDNSISETEEEMAQRLENIKISQRFESYWANYLKKIQNDNDYCNWKTKPFDAYSNR